MPLGTIKILAVVIAIAGAAFAGAFGASVLLPRKTPTPAVAALTVTNSFREVSRDALKRAFDEAYPSSLSAAELDTLNAALLSHWIGATTADGDLAIRFNPVADMFLLASLRDGRPAAAWWVAGDRLATRLDLAQGESSDRISLVFGERPRQMGLVAAAMSSGVDVITPFEELAAGAGANDAADAALRYVSEASRAPRQACHAELEEYAGAIDWKAVGDTYGIAPENFSPPG